MNHRDFLQSLSPEQKEQLTQRSNVKGLIHLTVHLGCILLCSAVILTGVTRFAFPVFVLLAPLIVFQGLLLVFLFTLLHETTHNTPFRSPQLNRAMGYLCGFLIFLPAEWFRHFHLAHHRYTHEPDKDPELESGKPDSRASYLLYLSGLPVWKSHISTLLRNALGRCKDSYVPQGRIKTITTEARWMTGLYGVVFLLAAAFAATEILLLWLIPLLLGQPFLRAYLLAEHAHCEHVADMFCNTRTTLTTRLVRRLAWNMPFHAEHHTFPSVPFHRLPQLHNLVTDYLQEKQDGYTQFNLEYLGYSGDKPRW